MVKVTPYNSQHALCSLITFLLTVKVLGGSENSGYHLLNRTTGIKSSFFVALQGIFHYWHDLSYIEKSPTDSIYIQDVLIWEHECYHHYLLLTFLHFWNDYIYGKDVGRTS